jgi:hypothetical protein
MTLATLTGVMATVSRIRWVITVRLLELMLRVMLLGAIFRRPVVQRERVRP